MERLETTSEGVVLVHTDTYERSFQGQLHYRANVANRQLSLDLLPAWKSHTVEWTFTRRFDGKPLESTPGLPLQNLPHVHADSNAPPSGPNGMDPAALTTANTPTGSYAHHISPESFTAAKVDAQPGRISGQIVDSAMANTGRTINVNQRGEKNDTKRVAGGAISKKTTKGNYNFGTDTEKTSESRDYLQGNLVVTEVHSKEESTAYTDLMKEEITTRDWKRKKKTTTHHYKEGERRTETSKTSKDTTVKVYRKENGTPLDDRESEVAVAEGSSASSTTRREVDSERAEVAVTERDLLKKGQPSTSFQSSTTYSTFHETDTLAVETTVAGGRKTEVHRTAARDGTFEKTSKNGGATVKSADRLQVEQTHTVKRVTMAEGPDGRPMDKATLSERQVEGVTANVELHEGARDHHTGVVTEYGTEPSADNAGSGGAGGTTTTAPPMMHTVNQKTVSLGMFSMAEQKSQSKAQVTWATADGSQVLEDTQTITEHVSGTYKATLAESTSTLPQDNSAMTHKEAVRTAEAAAPEGGALADVGDRDIELTGESKTLRQVNLYESSDKSTIQSEKLNEGALGGTRHTMRITDIKDETTIIQPKPGASSTDASSIAASSDPSVTRTRYAQGVDIMLKSQASNTAVRSGLFVDNTTTEMVEHRNWQKTSTIDSGKGSSAVLSDTKTDVSDPHLRETTKTETSGGLFFTESKKTVTQQALGSDGEAVGEASTEEKAPASGLTAGSLRGLTAAGSAVGSMAVKAMDLGVRGTKRLTLRMSSKANKGGDVLPPLGLEVSKREDDLAVVVMKVERGSLAHKIGLEPNDVIELIDEQEVDCQADPEDVKSRVKESSSICVARLVNANGLNLRKEGVCAGVSVVESFALGTAGAIASAAKAVPGAAAAVAAAGVVSLTADAVRSYVVGTNSGGGTKNFGDMTEEEQALEMKRVTEGRQRSAANTLMSVGTTLAMTATQGSGLGYAAAGAAVVGAVLRENLINEHAKEANEREEKSGSDGGDRTEKLDGRTAQVRLADVGCAVAPALAPLVKGAPGALTVGAIVEGGQAGAQAFTGWRKGKLSGEEALFDSMTAFAGCAAAVGVASSSSLAAGCSAAAVALFAVEVGGAAALGAGIFVPALCMAPAAYFGKKFLQALWCWGRGHPTERKLRLELQALCEKYGVTTNCTGDELKTKYRKESLNCHPDRAKQLKKSKEELEHAFVELTENFDRIRKLREHFKIPDTPTDQDFYTAVMNVWKDSFNRILVESTRLGRLLCKGGISFRAQSPAEVHLVC